MTDSEKGLLIILAILIYSVLIVAGGVIIIGQPVQHKFAPTPQDTIKGKI